MAGQEGDKDNEEGEGNEEPSEDVSEDFPDAHAYHGLKPGCGTEAGLVAWLGQVMTASLLLT